MGRRTIVRRPYFSTHDQVIHLLRQAMGAVATGARSIEHVDPLGDQLVKAQSRKAHKTDEEQTGTDHRPTQAHEHHVAAAMGGTAGEGVDHRVAAQPVGEHENQPGPLHVHRLNFVDRSHRVDRGGPVDDGGEQDGNQEAEEDHHDSRVGEDMDSAQKVQSAP